MSTAVQRRRGTTAQHSLFTGLVGEITIDTDKVVPVVHDGATPGGFPMLREDMSNVTPAVGRAALQLGNVNNTSDANKPVSSATQTALNAKKTDSMTTGKLLGRGTAATGVIEEITLGTNLSLSGTTLNASGGGGVADGDKGDITVSGSGATWTIDNGAVTLAKQVDVASGTVFYRKTSGVGSPEVQSLATLKTDLAITKADVGLGSADNTADTAKPVSTAQSAAINAGSSSYRTLIDCTGSHTAARVAGTYGMAQSQPLAISGTGTLYPLNTIYIAAADYPAVNGVAPKLRIRAQLYTNDVAPTGNYTFGLYPITRPATSGGAGLCIFTLGTVVAGSTGASFAAPAADGLLSAVSSDFALPADGHYVIGVVTTATVAASAHVHLSAVLQIHNA